MTPSALQTPAPGTGIDDFLAATNRFLGRINLEFGLREAIGRAALDRLLGLLEDRSAPPPGGSAGYERQVLHAQPDGHYCIAAIRWWPGARTPVHSHHTWCSFMVLRGELTERRYGIDLDGLLRPRLASVATLAPLDSRADERFGGIHQLANETGGPALSLHCYGVAGAQAATHVNRVFDAEPVST
jgi:predicted metal-dependent enzyme (double-stranded beta helix superfamily)